MLTVSLTVKYTWFFYAFPYFLFDKCGSYYCVVPNKCGSLKGGVSLYFIRL